MTGTIIYHHPLPITDKGISGSMIRPYEMLNAFRGLGYKVELVAGYGAERKKTIMRIKNDKRAGRQYSFIYAESSTMPTPLTERHHIPIYPFMDMQFLNWAVHQGLPTGLFYRDVYWMFPLYKDAVQSHIKSNIAIMFYRYEWIKYKKCINQLFLPSLKMKEALPTNWPKERITALPPGCKIERALQQRKELNANKRPVLKTIYVGGVTPPTYDIKPMIDIVHSIEGVEMTLCCRKTEWNEKKEYYGSVNNSKINVVHQSGEQLKAIYHNSDIAVMYRKSHPYLEFAMPVKLFEAVGYSLPVIVPSHTEMARIVSDDNIGWVIEDAQELKQLLMYLVSHPEEIVAKRENVIKCQEKHTWLARAKTVSEVLTNWRT